MISNNQLPRLDNNNSNRNIFSGGAQVVCGIILLGISISIWVLQKFVYEVFSKVDSSPISVVRWVIIIVGVWLLCQGINRLNINNTFRKLQNFIVHENITIEHLAELLNDSIGSLLKDMSIIAQRKYWGGLRVNEKSLEIQTLLTVPGGRKTYKIAAGEGMIFTAQQKHLEIPHPVVVAFLMAFAVLLPLPMTDLIWILVAIVASFPLRKVFNLIMPKKQFIGYRKAPEFVPEKIQLELSGDEQADELIILAEQHLKKLQELSLKIKDESLVKTIGELSTGLSQMTGILKENPSKHRQVRQTLDYSIPTAIKLYYKYIELDDQQVKGENIKKSMEKIHEMSDLVSSTFKRELNSLYQDQNLDIEVDVEVMRNMLQQESIQLSPLLDYTKNEDKNI